MAADTISISPAGSVYFPAAILRKLELRDRVAVELETDMRLLRLRRPRDGERGLALTRHSTHGLGLRAQLAGALRVIGVDPRTVRGRHAGVVKNEHLILSFQKWSAEDDGA